jgi:hypothetical protein
VAFLTSASETSTICSIWRSFSISYRIRSGAAAPPRRRLAGVAELTLQLGVGGLRQEAVPVLLPEGGSGLQRPAPIVGHPPQEALQPRGHDAPLLLRLADVAARFSSSACKLIWLHKRMHITASLQFSYG